MNRRDFLRRGAVALAAASRPARTFGIVVQDTTRPGTPCGVATGDVADGRAIVWSRTDRPARMVVEYSTSPSFSDRRRIVGPAALEDTDFTARVDLTDLPPGQRISYRVQFQDLSDLRTFSVPVAGTLQTASQQPDRDVVFSFSADCVGQGWGIDPAHGGLALYEAMRRAEPDVFIHLGDTIYADQPLGPAQVSWLQRALAASTSAWKAIASDLPVGLVVPDAGGRFEAVANNHDGTPSGASWRWRSCSRSSATGPFAT
jgi:alkaline phosphatase D